MRYIAAVLLLFSFLFTSTFAAESFQTEQAAQLHCPSDTVVWLNIPSGVFHFKGQRWYGKTKSGAYVCMQEALKDGDHATKNGQ